MKLNKIEESISVEKKSMTDVAASEMRYRRLFETAHDGILILDAVTGRIYDANPFVVTLLGYPKKDIVGKRLWEIGAFKDIKASKKAFVELQNAEYVRYEDLPLQTKDGRQINVEFISNVYLVNNERVVQCNIRDITDRRRAEEAVQRSLKEKEVLLRELHHRVKNNLQIISSLLQLKLTHSTHPEVISVFKQTQERIRVMALVHQQLCEASDFMSIDISEYVHELVDSLLLAYAVDPKRIEVKVNVDRLLFRIDIAVPCGLIINELLTNCLKYAFPNNRKGKITIMLGSKRKNIVEIVVSDDGIGFPAKFDLSSTKTMGLALVVSTVEGQLGGELKRTRMHGGADLKITFNI
jgi:PAS domain S-box-containing protein